MVEHWSALKRHARALELANPTGGLLDPEQFCAAIMHAIGLSPRDEAPVATLVYSAVDRERRNVDLTKLLNECRRYLKSDTKWVQRFQADGVLEPSMQKGTVGVCSNANRYQKLYRGPPFAISGDPEVVNKLQRAYLLRRCKLFQQVLKRLADPSDPAIITLPRFRQALEEIERYGCSDVDFDNLIAVMDPKRTGKINIQDFLSRFAFELLKTKSMRNGVGVSNSDGIRTVFEWPEGRSQVEDGDIKASGTGLGARASVLQSAKERKFKTKIQKTKSLQLRQVLGAETRRFMDELHDAELAAIVPTQFQKPPDYTHRPKPPAIGIQALRLQRIQALNECKPLSELIADTEQYRQRHIVHPVPPSEKQLGNQPNTVMKPRRPQSARV